jgi:hypothetical protein
MDFVTAVHLLTASDHFRRFKQELETGLATLERIQYLLPEPYDVPDVKLNLELWNKQPPAVDD